MRIAAVCCCLSLSTIATTVVSAPDAIEVRPTASERLAACEKVYREARNYQDAGTVTQVYEGKPDKFTTVMPFTTAFERSRRFRWEFSHGMLAGPPVSHRYTVWSTDGHNFESFWTLNKWRMQGQSLLLAIAGATGVSGGSATAIVPLLRIEEDDNQAIISTNLVDPIDKGTEAVAGVECWKIEGKLSSRDETRTLWIGGDGLIRKIYEVTVVDPTEFPADALKDQEPGPRFTVWTTIEIKPIVNAPAIPDEAFQPPAAAENEAIQANPK